jgi:hypothetical protein
MVKSGGPAFSAAVFHASSQFSNGNLATNIYPLAAQRSRLGHSNEHAHIIRLVHEVAGDRQAQTHEKRVRKSDIAHDAAHQAHLASGPQREQARHQIGGGNIAFTGLRPGHVEDGVKATKSGHFTDCRRTRSSAGRAGNKSMNSRLHTILYCRG